MRTKLDDSSDSLSKKIRNAETAHVNYILVVGEQEQTSKTLAVRNYRTKEQTSEKIHDFIKRIKDEIDKKKL